MRVYQQPGFVLHNRPYRESSWIVEVFTRDYGRIGLLAKGARRLKSRMRGMLQPFQPLLVSWAGKGELPNLTAAEPLDGLVELRGRELLCGFYCNELIVRLLHRYDPHPGLFDEYKNSVISLCHGGDVERVLRMFEKALLAELGYALVLDTEARGNAAVDPNKYYRYVPGSGPVPVEPTSGDAIAGGVLLAIGADDYSGEATLSAAKSLMRTIIRQLLGGRELVSRKLFYPQA